MHPDTLIGAVETSCLRWPDGRVMSSGDVVMTYAALRDGARSLAAAYHRLGIEPGDRVVCSVSNRPEHLVAVCAAWLLGAVHVGADFHSSAPELSRIVELTGARALLYEPSPDVSEPLAALDGVREKHPELLVVGGGDFALPGCPTLAELATSEADARGYVPPGPSPGDPALVFISSGTTGIPKATLGYHGNLAQRWQRLAHWLQFGPQDVHLAHLPLSHGFGMMMAMGAILSGGGLVLQDPFTAEEALRLIARERVTVLNGAPAHFKLLLSRLARHTVAVDSLRLSVGTAASFPPELVRGIWDELGVEFMYMYGSSEGVGVATMDRDDIQRGSVGRPSPGSVQVVDEERRPLPRGDVGEVAFSRRVFPVRYLGPAGTGSADEEWYYSGDLGRLDEDGRLYIFGRLKHQIDRGGLKVDPTEVEGALLHHPEILDAAVIGLPNPVLGETVCACVVPTPGEAPTLERLRVTLRTELAPYKLPEVLCILADIPRTRIGKIDLPALRATVSAAVEQQLAPR